MASKSLHNLDSPNSSRIPNFFKMSISERISELHRRGLLTSDDVHQLVSREHQLDSAVADKMIENVLGVFGLPLGVALNFLINNRDYVIPLVVEEPSIVAGLSGAARIARLGGGFYSDPVDTLLIGQVQSVVDGDASKKAQLLLAEKQEILSLANSLHPKMVARGGGANDIEVFHHKAEEDGREMVVMHLLVDTREAMGANMVNTMCEGVAGLVEKITNGKVFLRILSNLTDRAIARTTVRIPVANLEGKGFTGESVRDGIVLANDLALADPYRAATHNKGIMNGIDAFAIATGNDWRAIEASAHAYASRSGRYKALTRWHKKDDGFLTGEIEIPIKVGTVGGSLETNPSVKINHRLLGTPSASELAGLMSAVGLAQNFAALRSLATSGISQNHMNLHARSVASSAGVSEEHFEAVVERLIESGEIKVWKAQEIAKDIARKIVRPDSADRESASGKIILLGEHAAVYGRPAIALPIPLAVEASVRKLSSASNKGIEVIIPRWGVEQKVVPQAPGIPGIMAQLIHNLELSEEAMTIEVFPNVPKAMGLGGSSALAVAIIKALNKTYELALKDAEINTLAYKCEQTAHGQASGVDNTVATYGVPLFYQKESDDPHFETLTLGQPLELVIGITGKESLTAEMVARVRASWNQHKDRYESIFDQIGSLTIQAKDAVQSGQLSELGELMNLCHGYLNALQLSTPEIEELIHLARINGAMGAKLSGGGGGGSVVALCPDSSNQVARAIEKAGYKSISVMVGS